MSSPATIAPMPERTTLEWTYTPADFFEAPFEHSGIGYKLTICDGKVVAELSDQGSKPASQDVGKDLQTIFLGAQVMNHRKYHLSDISIRTCSGKQDVAISARDTITISCRCDAIVSDAQGNIKHDTRAERTEQCERSGRLSVRHRSDPTAAALLKSHYAAVHDPDNELVHLYEIREALAKKFGGEKETRNTLNISSTNWSRLGFLANKAPLNQGRHRGSNAGELRKATHAELAEARSIAKAMIRCYLLRLDSSL